MKTRITVVSSYFYPKVGGLENYAYNLAKRLHESGDYDVSIVTSNHEGKGLIKEAIGGMTVYRLPIAWKISNTPINLKWHSMVKRIFEAEKPNIVHIHSPVPFLPDLAARAAKDAKIVLTYHAGSMRKGKWPIDIIIDLYERILLPDLFRRADAVIAVSQRFAAERFPQFTGKTFFIPTGVDLNIFKQTPLPSKTETVTYVGRIEQSSQWKGIDELLQAMTIVVRKRPQARLELVGGGDAIDHYRAKAKALGIELFVTFTGMQTGARLLDAYRRSSMVVLPSTSDSEAFSVALIEAMASGRPIIGTSAGGTSQIVRDGENGFLVPPKDPAALAHAIVRVLEDRTRAKHMADRGAAAARQYSWETQTKRYSELFKTLVS